MKWIFGFLIFSQLFLTKSLDAQENNGPTPVYVGYYINSIRNVDLNNKTFFADFYLWLRFKTSSEERRKAVINKVEFMNVRARDLLSEMINDEWDKDDQHYISWRIQGDFTFDPELRNYPFDQQVFPISIENAKLDVEDLEFVSDNDSYIRSGLMQKFWGTDAELKLLEFQFDGTDIGVDIHKYDTDFGNLKKISNEALFSRSTIKLYFHRDYWGYVLKILLPLMIIVGMSYSVFFIVPSEVSASTGISVTALLSSLALNFVIAQSLPNIGYLIKSDHFFILSYILILITLGISVYSSNLNRYHREQEAEKLNKMGIVFFPILYMLTFAYLIIKR